MRFVRKLSIIEESLNLLLRTRGQWPPGAALLPGVYQKQPPAFSPKLTVTTLAVSIERSLA
jgi:hypothetical protein